MAKNIEQPELTFEKALMMVTEDKEESVELRGKTIDMRDIRKGALLKITDIMTTLDESDPTRSCKCMAAILSNSWWGIKAFWGLGWSIRWRWYYYVREYTDREVAKVVALAKKKAEMEMLASMINTTSLTAMKMTRIARNKEEASLSQAASGTETHGQAAKSSPI